MQVVVHDVDAEVTRAGYTQQSVHVGAIAVHQAARFVHFADHFKHIGFKQAEGVGVGEHEACQILVTDGVEGFQIDVAFRVGGQVDDLKTAHL